MFNSQELDCGYFTAILQAIITEYQYLQPCYRINDSHETAFVFLYDITPYKKFQHSICVSNLVFSH